MNYTQEKQVDTGLVTEMVKNACLNAFDIAVLLSGDVDFSPAVKAITAMGKEVWIATWGGSGMSRALRADAFNEIDLSKGIDNFTSPFSPPSPLISTAPMPVLTAEYASPRERINVEDYLLEEDHPEAGDLLIELDRAQNFFERRKPGSSTMGYCGKGFFLRRWESTTISQDPAERERVLDLLIFDRRVLVSIAHDGSEKIQINRKWPEEQEDPDAYIVEADFSSSDEVTDPNIERYALSDEGDPEEAA
jgi:hypothetical protein